MESKHIINIAGTVCPPEGDKGFNEWYDESHVPPNMKFPGLIGVTRYRVSSSKSGFVGTDYAKYMTTYKFKDVATFREWNQSDALTEACYDLQGYQQRFGFDMVWRAQYESLGTWGNTQTHAVVLNVGTKCPAKTDAMFNKWFLEKHIPDILKAPQVEGVVQYKLVVNTAGGVPTRQIAVLVKDYPQYLTFIFFNDVAASEAFDASPERAVATGDWLDFAKKSGASMIWRLRYEPMRTWAR
jgi:hypothetical protein